MRERNSWGLHSPPWWGSALIGTVIIVVLVAIAADAPGSANTRFWGWYTDASGRLETGLILDQTQYLRLVDHSAGRAPSSKVAPFTARALAPWLAGRLPFAALDALTIVNAASLILGTFALALLAKDLTRSRRATLVAVLVWSASFPVWRYTSAAFVDAAAVGLVPVVMLLLWRRLMVLAVVVFAMSIWMKETALSMLPMAIAFIWVTPDASRVRRLINAALWVVTALVAYVTAGVVGGESLIVFASWIPESFAAARQMFLQNVLVLNRTIAFASVALLTLFAVVMWVRSRRSGSPVLADSDAIPLVAGCVSGTLFAVYAIPTAAYGGRTVWIVLAPTALLIAGWVGDRDWATAKAEVASLARVSVVLFGVVGVMMVGLMMVSARLLSSDPLALGEGYRPRFAGVPSAPEDVFALRLSGDRPREIDVPGDGPVLIEFESDDPLVLRRDGVTLIGTGRARKGVTMFDPEGDRRLEVAGHGSWTLLIRPVASTMFWESISPVSGHGPNVIVYPGGTPRGIAVRWKSDDPDDRVELVGGCRLGTCGDLSRDGVVPPGTEALVIDARGEWTMIPDSTASGVSGRVLEGTIVDD